MDTNDLRYALEAEGVTEGSRAAVDALIARRERDLQLAWEAGFWAGAEAVRDKSYDIAMPKDWEQRALDSIPQDNAR